MNLIRSAISTPKRHFLSPHCTIAIQQLSTSKKAQASVCPRPSEIPYQPNLLNSLTLFGIIQLPIQFHATPDGQNVAATIIAHKDAAFSAKCFSILVVFEGDLAHSVASHVKPYDCVRVSGKLSLNPLPFELSENQGEFYLIGNEIKFVQGFVGGLRKDAAFIIKSWRDLVKNPADWWDYREKKSIGSVNANHPDYKNKANGISLWLKAAPNWVLGELEGLDVRKWNKENSWKDLFGNPDKWWDNRQRKTSVNSPDFLHKETREALWLNSSPKWVLAGPEGLEVLKGEKEDSWKDLVENPHKWWDKRPVKTNVNAPDFIHNQTGEALWLNSSPKWVLAGPEGLDVLKRSLRTSGM